VARETPPLFTFHPYLAGKCLSKRSSRPGFALRTEIKCSRHLRASVGRSRDRQIRPRHHDVRGADRLRKFYKFFFRLRGADGWPGYMPFSPLFRLTRHPQPPLETLQKSRAGYPMLQRRVKPGETLRAPRGSSTSNAQPTMSPHHAAPSRKTRYTLAMPMPSRRAISVLATPSALSAITSPALRRAVG
jgi:hypothetical protein